MPKKSLSKDAGKPHASDINKDLEQLVAGLKDGSVKGCAFVAILEDGSTLHCTHPGESGSLALRGAVAFLGEHIDDGKLI